MTHEVVLQGYNVKPGSLQLGTFDSYGIEKIHVTADDSWDGLAIVVTFNPPEGDAVEVRVPADGTVDVPPEATTYEGKGTIVFCGVDSGVQRITKTMGYVVITHANVGTDTAFTPSEDLAAQVLNAALSAERSSTEANTAAQGAQKAAAELGVTVQFMAPNTKDDAQQIECVNNAVSAGAQAIIVAANGPDAISSALREASDAGVKLIYVDSPANVSAEATFSTDNNAAGKTAGEEMKKALADAGVTSGSIGIINVNAATDSCVMREEGFRSAFEGTDFELLETQYGEGDAAKSQSIAENYITQGVVGIFGCNEGSTTGAGNAIKASGKDNVIGVGFDKSDAILGLIDDGYLLCTMAQNPDVMGYEGVKAAVKAINGESLGGAVTDTGVSVLTKQQ